jgi:nitrate/TMAO reductase-like tetraheme cytochrome c subunit
MPAGLVLTLLICTVVVIAIVIAAPGVTVSRGGKALAFLALFVFPVTISLLGAAEHMDRSKQTQFCLSCHVMEPYGKSLYVDDKTYVPAAHFQNNRIPRDHACYTCHTNYTIYGTVHDKLRGLKHAYKYYISKPANPIKLYEPFNNRECLHCHEGARSFEEGTTHSALMDDIKKDKIGCTSSGCHDVVHNVPHSDQLKHWSPQQ